jgi:hypothetical protein
VYNTTARNSTFRAYDRLPAGFVGVEVSTGTNRLTVPQGFVGVCVGDCNDWLNPSAHNRPDQGHLDGTTHIADVKNIHASSLRFQVIE